MTTLTSSELWVGLMMTLQYQKISDLVMWHMSVVLNLLMLQVCHFRQSSLFKKPEIKVVDKI